MSQALARILIVKMSAVGDVVMTFPALEALARCHPRAKIDWLVEPPADGLLIDHPHINRVIVSPRRQFIRLVKSGHLSQAWRLLRAFLHDLRRDEYDVIIDLQGLHKSAVNQWLARGRRKVGFAATREWTAWALNETMPAYDPERPAILRYLEAVTYLGAECPPPDLDRLAERNLAQAMSNALGGELKPLESIPFPVYYQPPPWANTEADKLLASDITGNSQPGFIVLNPGTKWLTKCWPMTHWLSLAGLIIGHTDLRLVITGGPEDLPQGQALATAFPQRTTNLCGRTTLPALAVIMARAQAVVTADTGPMHLAASVGGKGLALFGPTRPWRTGPGGGQFQILTPPIDCIGCLKKKCHLPCLELLTANYVWTHLKNKFI